MDTRYRKISLSYMTRAHHTPQSGFIALISVILLSAVLLLLVIGAGASGLTARMDTLGYENRRASRELALSCAQDVLLQYALSPGTSTFHTDCLIDSISTTTDLSFTVHASSSHAFSVIRVSASTTPHVHDPTFSEIPF